MRRLAILTAALALLAAGCGGDDKKPAKETAAATTAAVCTAGSFGTISDDLTKEPLINKPACTAPTDLVIEDIVKGSGPKAKTGDMVSMQYTGIAFSTGIKFDASWDRAAEPYQLSLGAGDVIAGWDQGIVGMRKGGRRLLAIPASLAYGAEGRPPAIAPNETLVFVLDLVKIG